MDTPEHYKSFYRLFIRFALLMLVFGGFAGVLFQELTRSLSFAMAPPGRHLEATYHLALLHGHGFLIGSVMPLCWCAALHLGLQAGGRAVTPRALRLVVWTYLPGAVSVLSLICYKGLHYLALVREGETDFDRIHESLFGGAKIARGIVYGVSHTVATIGLCIFAWVLWRSLGRRTR